MSVKNYGHLREHQTSAVDIARDISRGLLTDHVITAGITPGGGKTLLASLFCDVLLDVGMADQICVVVPNRPLSHQMRCGFSDPARGLLRYLVEESHQRQLPGMGRPSGRVWTYQAVVADPAKFLRFISKRRTILVLDECHHLAENSAWKSAIAPAVAAAVKVLAMSGTLSRGDRGRIPFITYEGDKARVHIRYSRESALHEHAILPIAVRRFDGTAFYEHKRADVSHDLSTAPSKEQARALKTALLDPAWVEPLVLEALRDWSEYCQLVYKSKAIIVCHSQDRARYAFRIVARNFPMARPVIAICEEPSADESIKKFRSGQADVLVTVRKAYEGLDVKDATHLAYLGDYRTFEFMDQVFARVTRVNPASGLTWEQQEARIFVPDDAKLRDYLDRLLEEQSESFAANDNASAGQPADRAHSTFRPDHAERKDGGMNLGAVGLSAELAAEIEFLKRNEPTFRSLTLKAQMNIANRSLRANHNG